jgi:hypothetical protein
MIFLKSLTGGLVCVVVMWTVILFVYMRYWTQVGDGRGDAGLGASAGGWDSLLHMPIVVALLTVAFGVGVYMVAKWSGGPQP